MQLFKSNVYFALFPNSAAANGDDVSSVDIEEVQSIVREIRSALDIQEPSEDRDGIDFSSLHPKFTSGSENGRASSASTELDCSEQPLFDLGHLNGIYTLPPQGPSENRDGMNFSLLPPGSENGGAPNASTELDCSEQPLFDLGHLNGIYRRGPSENRDGMKFSFLPPGSENSGAPNASTELDCSEQPLFDLGHLNGFYNNTSVRVPNSSSGDGGGSSDLGSKHTDIANVQVNNWNATGIIIACTNDILYNFIVQCYSHIVFCTHYISAVINCFLYTSSIKTIIMY